MIYAKNKKRTVREHRQRRPKMKEVIGCIKVDEFYRENGMTKWDDWHNRSRSAFR